MRISTQLVYFPNSAIIVKTALNVHADAYSTNVAKSLPEGTAACVSDINNPNWPSALFRLKYDETMIIAHPICLVVCLDPLGAATLSTGWALGASADPRVPFVSTFCQ